MNNTGTFRAIFLVAALYDFVLGIIFLAFYNSIFSFLGITLPNYPMYLQLSAAFVVVMGVGYFFVYKNLYRNVDLVKLGIVYKLVYGTLAIYFYLLGLAHAIFFLFALIDIIFIGLFIWFLSFAEKDGRHLKWS